MPDSKSQVRIASRHFERVVKWIKEGDALVVFENRDLRSQEFGRRQFVRWNIKRHGSIPELKSRMPPSMCQEGVSWQWLLVAVVRDTADIVKGE